MGGQLPWQEGVVGWLYPSAYSKVERVYSLQFQSGKFSLGKSSEEDYTLLGAQSAWAVRSGGEADGQHIMAREVFPGDVVQRRKAEIESERKVLKPLSRNGFEQEFP